MPQAIDDDFHIRLAHPKAFPDFGVGAHAALAAEKRFQLREKCCFAGVSEFSLQLL